MFKKRDHFIHVLLDVAFPTSHCVLDVLPRSCVWTYPNKLAFPPARPEALECQAALSYPVCPVVTSNDGDSGDSN